MSEFIEHLEAAKARVISELVGASHAPTGRRDTLELLRKMGEGIDLLAEAASSRGLRLPDDRGSVFRLDSEVFTPLEPHEPGRHGVSDDPIEDRGVFPFRDFRDI